MKAVKKVFTIIICVILSLAILAGATLGTLVLINKKDTVPYEPFSLKTDEEWAKFMKKQNMVFDSLPKDWDEGIFMGNGMLGTLIFYEKDSNAIHIEICRSDVADHRELDEEIPVSYTNARLPIGYFLIKPEGKIDSGNMELDLYDAIATGEIKTNKGSFSFNTFICRDVDFIDFTYETKGENISVEWVARDNISPRQQWGIDHNDKKRVLENYEPNPTPVVENFNDYNLSTHALLCGGETDVAWSNNNNRLVVTVEHSAYDNSAKDRAVNTLKTVLQNDVNNYLESHKTKWNDFYKKSFFSIPDGQYENFYWIQMYKYNSATRENGVIIDNQGPWLWETAWPYATWNLNVQLTYWALAGSNHIELGEPLIDEVCNNFENMKNALPEEYREDCLAIDTVASYGGISRMTPEHIESESVNVGNLVWAIHDVYRFYQYSGDISILEEMYQPLIESMNFMEKFTYEEDGKIHFISTDSPEYPTRGGVDSNYTLSIYKMGLKMLKECATKLGETEDCKISDIDYKLENLVEYPSSESKGFYIAKDKPFNKSHRHYSHLLMVYPFYDVTPDTEEGREMIETSLSVWQRKFLLLKGYSFTGAASMYAVLGDGDKALNSLSNLWGIFLKENTMYAESGPVIETPLSAAQSLIDMSLQSYNNVIRVFPAMPSDWESASFADFRAEGGHYVSANRKNYTTQFVKVTAGVDGDITICADFGGDVELISQNGETLTTDENNNYVVKNAKKGETFIIKRTDISTEECAPYSCGYENGNYYPQKNII